VNDRRIIELSAPALREETLGFFRWGRVGDRVVLTNDAGEWELLEPTDFAALLAGELDPSHPLFARLQAKCFVRDGADLDALAARLRRKKAYLTKGPHLHVVVTTLRCGQSCRYCHASRRPLDATGTDMSVETARGVVDRALKTTSPYVNFEFQGGEPTLNMDVIRFVVDYAREKNRHEGKQLDFSLVTGFSAMDEEKAEWLIDRGVLVCTSLDGPRELHDHNRPWQKHSSSFDHTLRWIEHFNSRYVALGRDPRLWHIDALLTTTRQTLDRVDEVLDTYIGLGIRSVHLRPLNPFGFARSAWKRIGYTTDEFLDFYERALDRIVQLNLDGVEIIEGNAAIVLGKMLTPDDPGYVDLRSPCGAGVGQMAYDYDGGIYPCDEARMVAASGQPLFRIGQVGAGGLEDDLEHPTVRAMAVASTQESLPHCSTCWNQPFCGVCPMHDFQTTGDLVGQRPGSDWCERWYRTSELLLRKLAEDDSGAVRSIFERWTIRRPREVEGADAP
jgi:uncharacterized protein